MVAVVVWLGAAKRRLREISDYYKETAGARTAKKIRDRIRAQADRLAASPQAGQREELLDGTLHVSGLVAGTGACTARRASSSTAP